MTVAELKALAKKRKVSLSAGGKKADIISAVDPRKQQPDKKTPERRPRKKQKSRPEKPAPKKAGKTAKKAVLTQKSGASRRVPARKVPEPVQPVRDWKMPPGAEEPLLAQERISKTKYYTGLDSKAASQPASFRKPTATKDRPDDAGPLCGARLLGGVAGAARAGAGMVRLEQQALRPDLRHHGCTVRRAERSGYYDQEVSEQVGNWYFDLGRPSHSFCADLGLLSPEGRFMTLVRSNYVTMPRDGVSDVIDEEWMLVMRSSGSCTGIRKGSKGAYRPEAAGNDAARRSCRDHLAGPVPAERVKAKARK